MLWMAPGLLDVESMSDSNRKGAPAFSPLEEEFFRAGAVQSESIEKAETFADLDEGYRPQTMWRWLIGRKATQG